MHYLYVEPTKWVQVLREKATNDQMSRPILERYGQNVPLLARQILIPVLAVGLCYGIETDVVQMVAQYIIRLLTARGELDSVLRAAFCHHPENYISLMEYYAPEEHGMEPFTRK